MSRFLPLLLLLGCHLIAAEDTIVDRCSMVCMQFIKCMEQQAAGMPEFKTCMKPMPPCNCGPMPQVPQEKVIINVCPMMCIQYMDCMANQAAGKPEFKTCMKPMPPCHCSSQPETAPESLATRCASMCSQYATCMEAQASGKPEYLPCITPLKQCNCGAKPEMAPAEAMIDLCATRCMHYQACMENQAAGKPEFKICMKPLSPCVCRRMSEEVLQPIMNTCATMCMKYKSCMENQAAGKPEFKTCMKPMMHCSCVAKPEIQPVPCVHCGEDKTKVQNDAIIHRCDVVCERYSLCRAQKPNAPCPMPTGCQCIELPENVVVLPMMPDPCGPCLQYWNCRRASMVHPTPPCIKPKECQCDMHQCFARGICEVDMPELIDMPEQVGIQQKMPCLKPFCNPEDDLNQPLKSFCNVLCNSYKKCRGDKNPQEPCVRPPGCNCPEVPMPMEEKSKEKHPITKCTEPCKNYWECRLSGDHEKPHLACRKPEGCMCDCFEAGMCSRDDIMPKATGIIPKEERCEITYCAQYWNCVVEKMQRPDHPELECVRPHGCKCDCLTEDICAFDRLMRDKEEMMPIEHRPVAIEQCSNMKCADFWMCSWMAVRDEKMVCVRPKGCLCSCAAAGICATADIPEIARLATEAKFVWPPRVVPMFDMKCVDACAKFNLCKKLFDGDRCQMTSGCNCGMMPIREMEPKH